VKNEMRILLLEDSATDANLVRHTLAQAGFAYSLELAIYLLRAVSRPFALQTLWSVGFCAL
jgi:hypothetical protein